MPLYVLPVLLALVGALIVALWLAWRRGSRRRSLPCPAWLSWMVDNPFSMRRTAATLRQLMLTPGLKVLDAGCGPGRLAIPIAEAVAPLGSVLAVDIQPDMLRRARDKAENAAITNIRFIEAGLGLGALPESVIDRAVLSTVLGEIPDQHAALREIYASLKPGGFLLVNEVIGDPHYQSLARVKALAKEVGFQAGPVYGSRLAYSVVLERRGGA
jgi:ubiquinone/menaquinone biosynthesis C-methylase UbiE